MESFVLVSFIGTFVLLTTQVLDYAAEVMRRRAVMGRMAMPDYEAPAGEEPAPWDVADQYDRAA